jgi:hypothetical protein
MICTGNFQWEKDLLGSGDQNPNPYPDRIHIPIRGLITDTYLDPNM